jgi:hypothetical protein
MLSTHALKQLNLLAPSDQNVFLLTISHPMISGLHFVVDNAPVNSRGVEYAPIAASLRLPGQRDEMPSASLTLDGVGHGLIDVIERTLGLRNATVLIEMIFRQFPDDPEMSLELDVREVSIEPGRVSIGLGFENTLGQIAISGQYRPAPNQQLF